MVNPAETLAAKEKQENAFIERMKEDKSLRADVDAYQRIAATQKVLLVLEQFYYLLERGDGFDGDLFPIARHLVRLADEEDLFTVLAGAGLTTQICAQAFINILVNLQLFPSKGLPLPLISYGGSSTVAMCVSRRASASTGSRSRSSVTREG